MNSSKYSCVCILDTESKYLESYFSWLNTIFRNNKLQDKFDVFIGTVDQDKFEKSNLFTFLKELQSYGKIELICPIQFHLHEQKSILRTIEMSTLLENFRSVNQQLHNRNVYRYYYQVKSNNQFTLDEIKGFNNLDNLDYLDLNLTFFATQTSESIQYFDFFCTGNEFVFTTLQNIIAYVSSFHNKDFKSGFDLNFYLRKLMSRQLADYTFIERFSK